MHEEIYCAVNEDGVIQWVCGSSKKTRYFLTPKYLRGAIAYHNQHKPDKPWRLAKFRLVPVSMEDIDE